MVGLRDYQDAKADVIMKYNSDEARRLKNMGHLPESVNVRQSPISLAKSFLGCWWQRSWRRYLLRQRVWRELWRWDCPTALPADYQVCLTLATLFNPFSAVKARATTVMRVTKKTSRAFLSERRSISRAKSEKLTKPLGKSKFYSYMLGLYWLNILWQLTLTVILSQNNAKMFLALVN